ncbi:peptidase C65 Otubain-domain-containing protein [Aspergillus egyptiacus]|nr:peptidase C65 Otubain-domain-containing protein [Aspergillus egyptiacus]
MKGDGNCGWRAVAFGFFEILFNLRDAQRVQSELVRIKSLNTLLDQVGQEEYLYDGFVEATTEVFAKILAAIEQGVRDDSFLVDLFNDEYGSNAIITHFRLLASAWMKLNPHRYQNFLLSMTVDQYCATRIETVKSEIDELGLQALVDGVIEGSGLAVEILYLDRSQGDSVNLHPLSQTRQGVGAIRLLYRPGHYDLLYQPEPTVNMQPIVNLQYAMSSDYTPWNTSDLSFDVNAGLMAIPNLMMDAPFGFAPSMSQPPSDPYRVSPPQEVYQPPVHTPAPPPPITSPSPQIRLTEPHPDMSSLPPRSNDGVQIRLNPLAMKSNLSHSLPVTPPFKNSPYNQAHFQNSDFEPIHWEPHESRR